MGVWWELSRNRWLVLGAAIWVQACDGVGYAYGSYSPIMKTALGYSQKQISRLGVAKDIGEAVGLLAGTLCDLVPIWGLFVIGAFMNLIGYGFIWMIVTGKVPEISFWAMCVLLCLAANGATFLNTGVLIACVRNFPHNRGGIVGILKGFTGLSGAVFTQLYTSFFAPEKSAFIFLVAVGPFMVTMFAMFIVRPIPRALSDARSDERNFRFIYSLCLVIAAYLMGAMVFQDLIDVSSTVELCFAFGLLILLFVPLGVPIFSVLTSPSSTPHDEESARASLLSLEQPKSQTTERSAVSRGEESYDTSPPNDFTDFSEMEDEKMKPDVSDRVRRQNLRRMSSQLFKAVAEGAVKVRRRKGPRRGEDFTLSQALVKADFWLLFFILVCGGGTGMTVIDNLGQLGEAQGYDNAHIFVSLVSIWSFLGRIVAGWASEIIARDYAAPRPILLAFAQALMGIGQLMLALGIPGSMYLGSLLIGFGYGSHWSVIPATASELFGLKNFGTLYNVITTALPTGSLIFSGLIAGPLYDMEAAKQQRQPDGNGGLLLLLPSRLRDEATTCKGAICFQICLYIMTAICAIGVVLNAVLIKRTYRVYQTLYGKNPGSKREALPPSSLLGPVVEEEEEGEAHEVSSSRGGRE